MTDLKLNQIVVKFAESELERTTLNKVISVDESEYCDSVKLCDGSEFCLDGRYHEGEDISVIPLDRLILVDSSEGKIVLDKMGIVLATFAEDDSYLYNIESFDLVEYNSYWHTNGTQSEYDILDLGYINKDGSKHLADTDFRNMIDLRK
ncbi:MAG: hypothetical protein MJH10_11545 [Epibacterium sp.]|nr:hypothetical protein [Epibacterium sp.]NQX74181.1 hypothetical protein [Epibacterium sp.]